MSVFATTFDLIKMSSDGLHRKDSSIELNADPRYLTRHRVFLTPSTRRIGPSPQAPTIAQIVRRSPLGRAGVDKLLDEHHEALLS